ncbi:GGDEF domain-containing protein, partial [bacterium]
GSVILVDIDHFKKINHKYGYRAGDVILSQVAKVIMEHAGPKDIIGRYGGEEFVWLMPETNQAKAKGIAEKMHAALTGFPLILPNNSPVKIAASIGVASFSAGRGAYVAPSLDKWIASADEALHQAMKGGGNKVVIYAPMEEAGG